MAKLVLTDCFIEVNAVDLSCFASSVEVNLTKTSVEANDFCGQNIVPGLETSGFVVNFHQSFAAAEVDDTLFPLWDAETEFTVTVRPTQAVVGTTNPEYTGTCRIMEYMPLSGAVGELSQTSVTFPVIGVMSRVTV